MEAEGVMDCAQEPLEAVIKRVALSGGARVVGIAAAESFREYAPEGHRPEDLLPGARSVVAFGGPTLTSGAWRSPDPRFMSQNKVFALQRKGTAVKVAMWIEENTGHYAVYYDGARESGLNPYMSLKLAAELAGLGTRSMAGGVILNPEIGLMNLALVITTLTLEPDAPLAEPVCPHPACVSMWEARGTTPCLASCPECLSGELRDGRIERMAYERFRCVPRAMTAGVHSFLSQLEEALSVEDADERRVLLLGDLFTRTVTSLGFSSELVAGCFKCLSRCPVCLRRTRLKEDPQIESKA